MKEFSLGLMVGFIQTTIGHPLDTLKTNYQNRTTINMNGNKIKILYRGVMKKTHPDLIKNDTKLLQMNLLANQYKNENNMLGMLDLCDQLGVKIPNLNKQHYDMMQQDIQDLQDQIEQIKKSHSYVWGTSDQKTRDDILNMILPPKDK